MNRVFAGFILVVMLLTFSGCKYQKEDLVFYVVKAEFLSEDVPESRLLSITKEHGRPVFTAENIKDWFWETQQITLKDVAVRGGDGSNGSALFRAEAADTFVLTLGNQVLLWGGFENKVGALIPDRMLYITDDAEGDSFHIRSRKTHEKSEDPRYIELLYEFLADHNLLVSQSD